MRWLTLALAASLGWGCAESTEPQEGDTTAPVGTNVAVPTRGADDPATGGSGWTRQEGAARPTLVHRENDRSIILACDERDGIVVELEGSVPLPPTEMMRISTAGSSSLFAVRPVQSSGRLRAAIPASDTMIERLEQGAPITIGYGDTGEEEIAASAAVPELVRQCRTSEASSAAG